MEFFPDRAFVRLRSRVRGTFLFADEDGVHVSLSPRLDSLNAAWAVHRVVRGGADHVLLHSAAYGRYLSAVRSNQTVGVRQRIHHDGPGEEDVLWQAVMAEDGSGDVLLCHRRYGLWRAGDDQIMRWRVQAIPPRQDPPGLPPPPPAPANGAMPQPQRRIRYLQSDGQGNLPINLCWRMLSFNGRSVFQLREAIAGRLGVEDVPGATLCVRAGSKGRLTPLTMDLPSDDFTIYIVLVDADAALALRHPDVDAP